MTESDIWSGSFIAIVVVHFKPLINFLVRNPIFLYNSFIKMCEWGYQAHNGKKFLHFPTCPYRLSLRLS